MESRFGADQIAEGVGIALMHYTRRLGSNRMPVAFPLFRRVTDPEPADTPAKLAEVAVGAKVEAMLQREAERQRVALEQILTHAVFVYLADIEANTAL
jgi:hypothetical protein